MITSTETTLTVAGRIDHDRPVHDALLDWCRTHGLDPDLMPLHQTIERNVEERRVVADLYVLDAGGKRTLGEDGSSYRSVRAKINTEAEPLPWPPILACGDCRWMPMRRELEERVPVSVRVPCEVHR